jgi:predicted transcriptional regulator
MATVLRLAVPGYRYKLKGKIHESGYRTQNEFAKAAKLDIAELSKILYGLTPTKPGLHKIADALSMSVGELKRLL